MQAKGSLAETNLRSLLQEAQTERATGTLTVRNGGSHATTLYFLFGHLFHALGGDTAGDEAVVHALGWSGGGEFDFDAKAKLPADETVKSSIPELLDRARAGDAPAADQPPVSAPEDLWPSPAPAQPSPSQDFDRPSPPRAEPEPVREPATEPILEATPATSPAPSPEPAEFEAQPEAKGEPEVEHQPRGVKHRPDPHHGREPVPVPAGQLIYDSLKTSFVDFPRLITTLERESYTGYVRLLTDTASGLIFFREGQALECIYDVGEDPSVELGKSALMAFNDEVTRGQGVLDVVALSPELVDGLYELTVAKPIYTELYASWVNMNALLRFLEERRLSGSLMVRAAAGTGVIILNAGRLAGAYTSESREISETTAGVLALCEDPTAMIEVKTAAEGAHQPLDVGDVVAGRASAPAAPRGRSAPAPEPAAPPAPPAPPPAPPLEAAQAWEAHAEAFTPVPAPARVPGGAPEDSGEMDWEQVIADLQQLTEEALGNRARKVKDVLGQADRSRSGIEDAIDQIPTISILFVDSSRLEALASDLRAKLHSYSQ